MAVSYRHRPVIELLLAADGVNSNHKDSGGKTPLWSVAGNGHEAVVKLLLATDGVEPDYKDDRGQTLLSTVKFGLGETL